MEGRSKERWVLKRKGKARAEAEPLNTQWGRSKFRELQRGV